MRTTFRKSIATAAAALAAVLLLPTLSAGPVSAGSPPSNLRVDTYLTAMLEKVAGTSKKLPVLIHGTDTAAAEAAVAASGLTRLETFDAIGVVVAVGRSSQIRAAAAQPGVTFLEGNRPIKSTLSTSHDATQGDLASAAWADTHDGVPLDGRGVSVAVIDTGVDGTHPFFRNADGTSAVVRNLKHICLILPLPPNSCFLDLTAVNDTDTLSVGGHGTHVAGIVAGRSVQIGTDQHEVHGAAPGAKLIALSVGAGLSIIGADSALNWVLLNHQRPCGPNVSLQVCPPIKVTNNSYGPAGGGEFDPSSATVQLQRQLAAAGVVTVWAAGNDGGDGSTSLTNPPGQDPTGGIISAASYYDLGTGTRDGQLSDFSSRGQAGQQGTYPDVAAPGEDIESACRLYLVVCSTGLMPVNGPGPLDIATFNTISGTSMAAPHIAGIVAQLFQAAPDATAAQIEDAIVQSAYQFVSGAEYEPDTARGGETSFDKGHGLVDVLAAVELLTGP